MDKTRQDKTMKATANAQARYRQRIAKERQDLVDENTSLKKKIAELEDREKSTEDTRRIFKEKDEIIRLQKRNIDEITKLQVTSGDTRIGYRKSAETENLESLVIITKSILSSLKRPFVGYGDQAVDEENDFISRMKLQKKVIKEYSFTSNGRLLSEENVLPKSREELRKIWTEKKFEA